MLLVRRCSLLVVFLTVKTGPALALSGGLASRRRPQWRSPSPVVLFRSLHIYDPTGKEEEDGGLRNEDRPPPTYFPGGGRHALVGNKYILASAEPEVSSGKSAIYEAVPVSGDERVVVKLSPNVEALQRERDNYARITANAEAEGLFVRVHDYVEDAFPDDETLKGQAALIMERGEENLQTYVRRHGPLRGQRLQDAMRSVAEIVAAVHRSKMVWTEIKGANFVVTPGEDLAVKGIDLESVVPRRANPIDFTAEAMPPCFAVDHLCGREPHSRMEKSFDIWSTGIVFYKLATAKPYFDGNKKDSIEIAMALKKISAEQGGRGSLDLDKHGCAHVLDEEVKDLLEACLKIDPVERPAIGEVLQHPFFSKKYSSA